MVERLFLTAPQGCLQFVIVVFPDHTRLLFLSTDTQCPFTTTDVKRHILCHHTQTLLNLSNDFLEMFQGKITTLTSYQVVKWIRLESNMTMEV